MVFFNCNACGQTVKKNQVEKHYLTQCPQCEVLSCLDCGVEFYGDGYKTHVKCITEDEKYGSVENRPIAGKAKKGDVKQENWMQQVRQASESANLSPRLKNLLQQISEYSNVPRKKAKFQNFLKNSLRVMDAKTSEQLWDIFSSTKNKENQEQSSASKSGESVDTCKEAEKRDLSEQQTVVQSEKSKTEEKVKKVKHSKDEVEDDDDTKDSKRKKKKKKREKEDVVENGTENEPPHKKMKKRQKNIEDVDKIGDEKVNDSDEVSEQNSHKKKKSKRKGEEIVNGDGENEIKRSKQNDEVVFNWKTSIKSTLKSAPGNELSMKKLRKKVFKEYRSLRSEASSEDEDEIIAAFNHSIEKSKKIVIEKKRVKLIKS